jgi:hypothetical protein
MPNIFSVVHMGAGIVRSVVETVLTVVDSPRDAHKDPERRERERCKSHDRQQ